MSALDTGKFIVIARWNFCVVMKAGSSEEAQSEVTTIAPEVRRQLGEMRERLQATVGQVVWR